MNIYQQHRNCTTEKLFMELETQLHRSWIVHRNATTQTYKLIDTRGGKKRKGNRPKHIHRNIQRLPCIGLQINVSKFTPMIAAYRSYRCSATTPVGRYDFGSCDLFSTSVRVQRWPIWGMNPFTNVLRKRIVSFKSRLLSSQYSLIIYHEWYG